jgi:hypothetical protein
MMHGESARNATGLRGAGEATHVSGLVVRDELNSSEIGRRLNLGEHPKPATHDHLKTGHR